MFIEKCSSKIKKILTYGQVIKNQGNIFVEKK